VFLGNVHIVSLPERVGETLLEMVNKSRAVQPETIVTFPDQLNQAEVKVSSRKISFLPYPASLMDG
jgi:hypothetical protein